MATDTESPKPMTFSCPRCCKKITMERKIFVDGGHATCQHCGLVTVFKPHKNAAQPRA